MNSRIPQYIWKLAESTDYFNDTEQHLNMISGLVRYPATGYTRRHVEKEIKNVKENYLSLYQMYLETLSERDALAESIQAIKAEHEVNQTGNTMAARAWLAGQSMTPRLKAAAAFFIQICSFFRFSPRVSSITKTSLVRVAVSKLS